MAYLDRQRSDGAPDAATKWRFYEGNRVGELARTTLGEGRMLAPPFSIAALDDSAAAIAEGNEVLFEASMSAAGMVARADALLPCSDGWKLVEVKSAKIPENGVPKADYLDDVAYTLCVAQMAGVPVARVSLMLLSREYSRGASTPLFAEMDVTAASMARAAELRSKAPALVEAISGDASPTPLLNMACKGCEYFSTTCVGEGVDDSILRIPRISATKLAELLPCERIGEIPSSASLTQKQQFAVDIIKSRGVWRDPAVLSELRSVRWPAFYLDFETVMPALPWFDGDRAYTTFPNQYSVHICSSPGAIQSHAEYLAPLDVDWRRQLTEQLLDLIDGEGSIVVYSSYEQTQLSAMAKRFPDLADRISQVLERLLDLERVFMNGYVHHSFAGASSIKKVLPVLVPDLSYETMAIGNGSDAAAVFSLMREGVIPAEEHDAKREELLAYCALDTLAMVRLHEALAKL